MSKATVSKKKLNLKERLTDDCLDLSLCDLETVPVKEIAELTKVRRLNLSFNALTHLPEDFIKLQNIRELDLSKNHIRSLPKNFGQLANLKSIDLLGNELNSLPSSFSELKSLQWLDLKDNPLSPQLKQAAGDCLDEAQCKKCAINVLRFVRAQSADEERQRQAELRKKKDEQLKKEAEEKEKANELKLLKKQEREQRRLINEQKRLEREKQQTATDSDNSGSNQSETNTKANVSKSNKNKNSSSCLRSLCSSFLFLLFLTSLAIGVASLLTLYCETNKKSLLSNYEFLKHPYAQYSMKLLNENVCPRLKINQPVIQSFLKSIKIM